MTPTVSSPRGRPPHAAALAVAAAVALAAPLRGQAVLLELRPHAGDTIRMRLVQQVEMTGTMRMGIADSTTTVVTTLRALTHAVVERGDTGGTVLATTADSVEVTSTGGHRGRAAGLGAHTRDALRGRVVRLRVAPDGATEVLGEATLTPELRAFFSQMPATLPRGPVSVGDRWSRTMQLPAAGARAGPGGGVSATFRLDSLTRGARLAHISMRGVVTRRDAPADPGTAMRVAGDGEVFGAIVVDRRRGWLADARTVLTVRSTITRAGAGGAGAGAPLRFRMRVDEWLHAVER